MFLTWKVCCAQVQDCFQLHNNPQVYCCFHVITALKSSSYYILCTLTTCPIEYYKQIPSLVSFVCFRCIFTISYTHNFVLDYTITKYYNCTIVVVMTGNFIETATFFTYLFCLIVLYILLSARQGQLYTYNTSRISD